MASTLYKLAAAVLAVFACFAAGHAKDRTNLNQGWRFAASEERPADDSRTWLPVTLPHTWNAEDVLDDEQGYRRAPAWYRRELAIPAALRRKRLFLYFEGVNHTAEVFVNGSNVGRHIGGYTAFAFDITSAVKPGRNSIAVLVDNTRYPDVPPIDGDFNMYGGIYRDVWLMAASDVHFAYGEFADGGVHIATPSVSHDRGTVLVSGTLANAGDADAEAVVSAQVLDGSGVAGASQTRLTAAAGSAAGFRLPEISVPRPKLWSPDSPYLYAVRVSVSIRGRIVDTSIQPLGFRWFRFDPETGFHLNGRPLKLRGTNRHQDRAGLGNAVPDRLQVRDLEIIKADGFNFLRLAHYPQDPAVLAAADRLGLLLWEEIPIVNQIHVSETFGRNAERMLREMIRQHRNHPSVLIWGFMNEVFLPVPKSESVVRATVGLARRLQAVCREEDPSRPTAIAFDHGARELYHSSGLSAVTDVIGWNLYHGWYYETFDGLGRFLDEEHRRFPDRPLILSEYGANGDRRVHSAAPRRFDSTIQWQQLLHEAYLRQLEARPFVAASAVWNQFDFGSEFRGETIPHINQKGLYTFDRRPKDVAFLYRANLAAGRVVHIAVRDRPVRSGPSIQPVTVYTNMGNVELLHNGRSLGRSSPDAIGRTVWNVSFSDGQNILEARAASRGRTAADRAVFRYIDPRRPYASGLAVNAGSNAEYFDGRTLWLADTNSEGNTWTLSGPGARPVSTLRNILGTEDDPLFQTMAEGVVEFRARAAPGLYDVEVLLAEHEFREPGRRVFGISANGSEPGEIDIVRDCGAFRACRRSFPARVGAKGEVLVRFAPRTGRTLIAGIRLRPLSSRPPRPNKNR